MHDGVLLTYDGKSSCRRARRSGPVQLIAVFAAFCRCFSKGDTETQIARMQRRRVSLLSHNSSACCTGAGRLRVADGERRARCETTGDLGAGMGRL